MLQKRRTTFRLTLNPKKNDCKSQSNIARNKRPPLYYRRITAQETSGENLSSTGQSVTLSTRRYGDMNSMQLTLSQYRPIKNSVIRIELSPSPEHTQFYDIEDWQTLWQEFAEEFDRQVITGKNGKVRSCPDPIWQGGKILSLVAYGIQRRSPSPPCCDLPFG